MSNVKRSLIKFALGWGMINALKGMMSFEDEARCNFFKAMTNVT